MRNEPILRDRGSAVLGIDANLSDMIGDPNAPGGLWADVDFNLEGASASEIEALVHRALGLVLHPEYRDDEPGEEPYEVTGQVLGHMVRLNMRLQGFNYLELGHEVWFNSSTIRMPASPLPDQAGLDISHALATRILFVAGQNSHHGVIAPNGA